MQARVGHVGSYVTPMAETERWRELGQQLRVDSIRPSAIAGSGHPTSGMSAADLMAVLVDGHLRYDWANPASPTNDRLVFSKGHASTLLYGILRAAGAISEEDFDGYRTFGSSLEGHPDARPPVGRRRHGVARPGAADRRRHGHRGQEPRPAPVPRLGAVRRLRARRGLDVGGLRARRALRPGQPHRDRRREPARPARRDDGRARHRRARGARASLRVARDRDRRPRHRADRQGVLGCRGADGAADRDLRRAR